MTGALLAALVALAAGAAEPLRPAAGLGLGAVAIESGSGEHPLAPALGAWGRLPLGPVLHVELETALARRSEGGALAAFDERWYRAALGLGCSAGSRRARVAASLGPAFGLRVSRIEAAQRWRASSAAAGLRWRGGLLLPLWTHGQLGLLAGGSTRGRAVDFDLLLEGGVRW